MTDSTYQMYLYLGPTPPALADGLTLVDVTPSGNGTDKILAALSASSLTAADLRTRTLFVADPAVEPEMVLTVYAAVCGFAGRFVDFTMLEEVTDARRLSLPLLDAPDAGKADPRPELVQFGLPHPDPRAINYPAVVDLSLEDVSKIRSARQAVVHIGGLSTTEALELLVTSAALRARKGADRYPRLLTGDLQVDLDATSDPSEGETATGPGIDLDAVRRSAAELRRSRRTDDRQCLVERVEPDQRSLDLITAAAAPLETVLTRLGSRRDDESGFWRCPRPDRHRNGDANPSSRLVENHLRCFRCDPEPLDPLRLVMDTLGVTPDEAAGWILQPAG